MKRIGLTGGIGSGKSTISKVFELLGIPTYSADDHAKILMNTNPTIKSALIQYFGEEVYADNAINKQFLSRQIFGNEAARLYVNSVVHPIVLADFDRWCESQNACYVLHESALLFEQNLYRHFDKNITVVCDIPVRVRRVCNRDGVDEAIALKKINSQCSDSHRINIADFVIDNSETDLLIPQILNIHKQILDL